MLSDVLEVIGLLFLVAFATVVWAPAGLLVAGIFLVFVGYSISSNDVRIKLPTIRIPWKRAKK